MSLANLKKSRGSSIDKLVNAAAKLNESSADVRNGPDERVFFLHQKVKNFHGFVTGITGLKARLQGCGILRSLSPQSAKKTL